MELSLKFFLQSKGIQFEVIFIGLFPVCPIPFRPFPFCPNFSRFAHSFFTLSNFVLFPLRPISVLLFCRFAQFHFCPFFISPRSHLAQLSHFALFPQGPFPFHPNAIFLISGPKANKKFSNNLIPRF